jgi:hypothetical protein
MAEAEKQKEIIDSGSAEKAVRKADVFEILEKRRHHRSLYHSFNERHWL